MPTWRLEPKAEPDDPRWLDHAIWREVVVRAPTSGAARLIASRLERDPERPPAGNENPSFQSGFEDDKLYAVRLQSQDQDDEPEVGIVRAVRAAASGPGEHRG